MRPSQFSTDGSGLFNNEFNIDGVTNTFSDSVNVRVAFSPPQAAIQEFKVQTSSFDAANGHTMGSVVNINSKGGTSGFHGSAWWWLRHSDSRFADDLPEPRSEARPTLSPSYKDNRYGLSGGAPLIIPKIYNGKNRTFWQFTWEANKFGDPSNASTSSVPRAAWRNGDLSDLLKLGPQYQIYDPATIKAEANGTFSPPALPGNIIPANRLEPGRPGAPEPLSAARTSPAMRDGTQQLLHLRQGARRLLDHHRPRRSRLSTTRTACSSASTAISGRKTRTAHSTMM